MTRKKETVIKGIPAYAGIAVGEAYLHKGLDLKVLRSNRIEVDNVKEELERLDWAVEKSLGQISDIERKMGTDADGHIGGIFKVQRHILNDRNFLNNIRESITNGKANIEFVISNEIKKVGERFKSMENEMMKTRFMDIQDIYNRLLRNVLDIEHVRSNPFKRMGKPVIMAAQNILPSDIALLEPHNILGFAVEQGSLVSHVVIIARTLGVPALIKASGLTESVESGDRLLLDANRGEVIVAPLEKTINDRRKIYSIGKTNIARKAAGGPCFTGDRRRVILEANIGTIQEARLARKNGAEGVGLQRSEFFYMSHVEMPSQREETGFYRNVLEIFKDKPVNFRLLDLGSDKTIPCFPSRDESNPQMGIRGIRYLNMYPDIIRRQLKCILSSHKNEETAHILLPFITLKSDLQKAKKYIEDIAKEQSIAMKQIRVGIMVEVPSVALDIENYLDSIDFISIGTNDLLQYMYAVSREDSGLEDYRNNLHPLMLRVLKEIIKKAEAADIPVSICGEMAGDPVSACVLMGLGAHRLSMQPQLLSFVRQKIMKQSYRKMEAAANELLECRDLRETEKIVKGI